MAKKQLLSIKNLSVRIGEKLILNELYLNVGQGEFHVLLGQNGSGKSTLANVLAGSPSYQIAVGTKTQLQYQNLSLLEASADERARSGMFMAFQQPVEVPGVKVLNFLWEAYKTRFPEKLQRKWSTIVEFRDALLVVAHELGVKPEMIMRGLNEGFSGGEKKRLEIVQMSLLAPKLAILDEIDSGLDVDALKLVARGVQNVRSAHDTAVLMITHHQRILEYFKPDKVHVMHQGKIVVSGGVELIEEIEKNGYSSVIRGL